MEKIGLFLIVFLLTVVLWSSKSLAQDYTQWHLPEGAKMRLGKGATNDITFSPDGTQFAVTTRIGIWIYDTQTGTEITMLQQLGRGFGKVAFSPDGHTLACTTGSSGRGEVQLWDKASEKLVTTLPSPIGISSLFFSKDGTKLACAGYFGRVHVWEISTETPPVLITDVKLDFKSWSDFWLTELSPDGRFLAIAMPDWQNRDFSIQLRDGTTGKLLHILAGHTRAVESITFSPDSKILVSGDEYETIRMWDTETGNLKSTMDWRFGTSTHALRFSPKGRFLASGHRDGVRLWHYTVGEGQHWDYAIGDYQNIMDLKEHKDYIYKFAFSPDELTLLTGSKDGTIIAWDTTTGNRRFTCTGHLEGIRGVALSETGGTITTLNQPVNPPGVFQQRRWDINTGELLSTSFEKGIDATTMAVSPDGKTVVTHGVSGNCVLWDISSRSPQMLTHFALDEFPRAGLNVRFAFALDGKMLAAGGQDHTVHVWDIVNNSLEHKFTTKEHTNYVWSLAFSPDGKKLASGSRDEKFRISNIEDAKTLYLLGGHSWRVNSFAFSPDNKILASGSYELFLWDVESGTQIKHIKRHQRSIIWALAFSPDGNILLIGGGDGLKMYDLPSERMLTLDPGFTNILKLSTDGKVLVSGSASGGILIWDWERVKKRVISDYRVPNEIDN